MKCEMAQCSNILVAMARTLNITTWSSVAQMPSSLQVDKEATTALLVLLLCSNQIFQTFFSSEQTCSPARNVSIHPVTCSSLHPFITSVLELASKQGQLTTNNTTVQLHRCAGGSGCLDICLCEASLRSAHLRDFFPRMKVKLARVTMD